MEKKVALLQTLWYRYLVDLKIMEAKAFIRRAEWLPTMTCSAFGKIKHDNIGPTNGKSASWAKNVCNR